MEILGLDDSLVQINFSHWFFILHVDSACTNQLYPSALFVPCSKTLKIFYWNTQYFEVMTNPIDQGVMVKIRERIASFILSQVINPKGEFHCDSPGLNYVWTKNVNCTMKDEPRACRIWNQILFLCMYYVWSCARWWWTRAVLVLCMMMMMMMMCICANSCSANDVVYYAR